MTDEAPKGVTVLNESGRHVTHDDGEGVDVDGGHLYVRGDSHIVAVYAPGQWHSATVRR